MCYLGCGFGHFGGLSSHVAKELEESSLAVMGEVLPVENDEIPHPCSHLHYFPVNVFFVLRYIWPQQGLVYVPSSLNNQTVLVRIFYPILAKPGLLIMSILVLTLVFGYQR